MLWGNDVDSYQFSGIDTFVTEEAASTNIFDVNGVITLSDLDDMLDAAEGFREVQRDPKVFLMSRKMISKVSGLQTKIQRQVPTIEYEGGFRMVTYNGVPIVPTDFVRPASTTTSPSDLSATATTGGTLSTGTYYYNIASVTLYGEQIAGGEVSVTVTGSNNAVSLSWTADSNAKLYKIYRGTSSGASNLNLIKVIAAKTYDSNGNVSGNVTSFTDTGYSATSGVHPLSSGEECIFLVNLNETRGAALVHLLGEMGEAVGQGDIDAAVKRLIRYIPLATTKSAYEFILETFIALQVPWAKLHAIARRAKVA